MPRYNTQVLRRLLIFSLPSFEELNFGLTIGEVETMITLQDQPITAVPLSPSYVHGITLIQNQVATLLDLGAALGRSSHVRPGGRCVVARIPMRQTELALWPIRGEASTIMLPAEIRRIPLPSGIPARLVHDHLAWEDVQVLLLNLTGLS